MNLHTDAPSDKKLYSLLVNEKLEDEIRIQAAYILYERQKTSESSIFSQLIKFNSGYKEGEKLATYFDSLPTHLKSDFNFEKVQNRAVVDELEAGLKAHKNGQSKALIVSVHESPNSKESIAARPKSNSNWDIWQNIYRIAVLALLGTIIYLQKENLENNSNPLSYQDVQGIITILNNTESNSEDAKNAAERAAAYAEDALYMAEDSRNGTFYYTCGSCP
jgi:hypothetical protein